MIPKVIIVIITGPSLLFYKQPYFFEERGSTSSGKGNNIVEFFSEAMFDKVWYNLNLIAEGDLSIFNPASKSFAAACSSASAKMILALLERSASA